MQTKYWQTWSVFQPHPWSLPGPSFPRLLHGWVAGLLVKRCSALVKNVSGHPKRIFGCHRNDASWRQEILLFMDLVSSWNQKQMCSEKLWSNLKCNWRCEHVQICSTVYLAFMYWMYWFPKFEPVIALYFEEVLGKRWGETIQALRGDTICVNATAVISSFNLFWVMA